MSKIFEYGDNVDTDVIIPARFLNTSDPQELAEYCMIDIDESFNKRVAEGDIIVGGKNFGCGSSREHAPIAIKASGIKYVIAESFARIFFRNAINIGLPIIESEEIAKEIEDGDQIVVDVINGKVENKTKGKHYEIAKYPEFMQNMINNDGLLNSIKGAGGR